MEGSPLNDPKGTPVAQTPETKQFTALMAKILGNPGALQVLTGHHVLTRARLQLLRAITQRERKEGKEEEVTTRMVEAARVLVLLGRCRVAGGLHEKKKDEEGAAATEEEKKKNETDKVPKPMWEPVLDRLLTNEGADEMRDEVAAVLDQHSLLAGAFKKFGFEGSVGV